MSGRVVTRVLLFAVLAAGVVWALVNRDAVDLSLIEDALHAFGAWAPVVFVLLYAVATVLFLTGSVFSLAGGALFGPLWGTLFNLAGATIGAVAAFLVTRYLVSDWVRARTGARVERLIAGVEAEGWRFVAFVRLVPLFPFNLANYAFGLTRIGQARYAAVTFVCMIPGAFAFAFTYAGHAGRGIAGGDADAVRLALLAASLLVAVALLPRLVSRLRRGGNP